METMTKDRSLFFSLYNNSGGLLISKPLAALLPDVVSFQQFPEGLTLIGDPNGYMLVVRSGGNIQIHCRKLIRELSTRFKLKPARRYYVASSGDGYRVVGSGKTSHKGRRTNG